MRGGGKAFGPRSEANFEKNMPREMRRAALLSCLSWQAKKGGIVALESYPDDVKTKKFAALLSKLPVEAGRKVLVVLPAHHRGVELSVRNMPKVKALLAPYLNPEDILGSKLVVFLVDAIKVAEQTFGARKDRKVSDHTKPAAEATEGAAAKPAKKTAKPKTAAKKPAAAAKKAPAKKKAASSDSK
jgi:ribosomal protein L4